MARGATKTKAPVEDVEETEDLELEDLDASVEGEAGETKSKAQQVEFGASDLARYLSEQTGKTISPRDLRALIRKMAREETPRVNREIAPGNRTRYDWPGGLEHPEVKAIVHAVTGGEMEADKQEKLAALKAQKAAKNAEKGKGKGGKKARRAAAAAASVDEDDDVEEIELDDDE